jgi:hypothetical protein
MLVVLILGIYIEYKTVPVEFLTVRGEVKKAYATIQQRQDIQVLLEYPIGNSIDYAYPQARMEELDAHYLAYALLYHDKKLINGYSGFIPKEYYKRAEYLSIHFPTRSKLAMLKTWGVDAIVVHEDEFTNKRTYADILSSHLLGVPILMSEKGVTVFDLTAWQADP